MCRGWPGPPEYRCAACRPRTGRVVFPYIKNWRRNDGSGLVEILRYNDQGAVGGLDRTGLPPEPESTGWQSAA